MASIKEALEEACENKSSYIKMLIYAIPVFISYELFKMGNIELFKIVCGATVIMLITILVLIIYNVRNLKNYTWPTFNILDFGTTTIKAIFGIYPVLGLCSFCAYKVANIQLPEIFPNIQIVYSVIIWLLFSSIMLTSFMFFSKSKKILEAYNFKKISYSCIDIIVAVLFFIPQLAILNILVYGPVVYLFSLFWGFETPVFAYITSVYAILNLGIIGNYLAQIDYENVGGADELNSDGANF